jgi:hypothetical protein
MQSTFCEKSASWQRMSFSEQQNCDENLTSATHAPLIHDDEQYFTLQVSVVLMFFPISLEPQAPIARCPFHCTNHAVMNMFTLIMMILKIHDHLQWSCQRFPATAR